MTEPHNIAFAVFLGVVAIILAVTAFQMRCTEKTGLLPSTYKALSPIVAVFSIFCALLSALTIYL